jgi:hypothetical protein
MGQQLAKRLTGGEAARIDLPISPISPIRFHAGWPIAVRGAVLLGRVRDRLGL